MDSKLSGQIREITDAIYSTESRRILATLIRLLGDFDLAEDALHDAFRTALEQWPEKGVPSNPGAWLVSTGRFKAIDRIRRRSRFDNSLADLADRLEAEGENRVEGTDGAVEDDQLRLIFTCCHPILSPNARIALTLREVEWNNSTLINENASAEISRLKAQDGKDMYVFGSADLSETFINDDLFDEYRIGIAPVILGSGRPLFKQGISS